MLNPIDAAQIRGRSVVITGGSRGFGLELAKALMAAGADLLLTARPSAALTAITAELQSVRQNGQAFESIAGDITHPAVADELFSGRWETPDVLVNCAAVQGPIGHMWEIDFEEWRQAVEVDFIAPSRLCYVAIRRMIIGKRGGVIINLSGGGATSARPAFSAYAAAKTALVRLTECLAAETAELGIAITAVAPGAMPTAMLEKVVEAGEARSGIREYESAQRILKNGAAVMEPALALCVYLTAAPRLHLSGKLLAAQWDPWRDLESRADELKSDVYTLRRIVLKDGG